MNKLIYKTWTFEDDQVKSGSYYLETSLPSASLGINTLDATVKCSDPTIAIFAQNDPVTYFYKGNQRGIYYIQSVERIGPDRYTLTAVSALGLLAQKRHPGGIYTGQTVQEVVTDICGDIPVIIKSNLANIALYGWLPYVAPPKTSAKDNLSQVLFAIGAAVTNDLDGVLRIEPLWSGVSGVLDDDHVCQGGKVTTEPAVTAVSVTEHQYFQGGETKELFNGSTQAGDIITFDEPAYDLVAEGFTILESGANYAKVSAGSGTLTGNTYIHNTRQVTVEVTPGPVENIKTPTGNPTLVSLVNSYAVAQRLAAYYKCRETIKIPALIGGNRPGAVVSMFHPYDKKMVNACLAVADARMSSVIKADLEALVGYEPPDISEQEYYDARIILTGEGDWDPPEGITQATAVLIGGAQGGWSGHKGNPGESSGTTYSTKYGRGILSSKGGDGGAPGAGGKGGKVLVVDFDINPGDTFHYSSGVGGPGGVHSATESVEGSYGRPSTFGPYSSDDGASMENGYLDVITGEKFAVSGDLGIKGGKGGGVKDGATVGDAVINEAGESVIDESGNTWTPGAISQPPIPGSYSDVRENGVYLGQVAAGAGPGLGGGAAAGCNGFDGSAGYKSIQRKTTSTSYTYNLTATGGPGGKGGDASAPSKTPGNIGKGGRGGNGGGGGGGFGIAECSANNVVGQSIPNNITVYQGTPGEGGNGSDGGKGGDGCIIVYYRIPKEVKSGSVTDKTGRFILDRTGRLMVV